MSQNRDHQQMRFGLDAEALRLPLSGVGQYAYNLCCELEHALPDATFFAYGRLPARALRLPSSRWILRAETVGSFKRIPSFLWLKTRGRQLASQDKLDVFWAPRTVHPRLKRCKTVITVHDLNHLIVPDTMETVTRVMHRVFFRNDVYAADLVLANSEGTAQRLRSLLGLTAAAVIRPGLNARFKPLDEIGKVQAVKQLATLGVRPPYLISVATLEPRKNTAATFEAFLALKKAGKLANHQLVLVGSTGWANDSLLKRIKAAADSGVVLTGYVDDDLLPALYGLADALVYPSIYEGFGMPVLEARACGTPAVVHNTPELREAGGAETVVVDRPTPDAIAAAIEMILASDTAVRIDSTSHHWPNRAREMLEEVSRLIGR